MLSLSIFQYLKVSSGSTVECRNPNVRISDSAENQTIDRSVIRRSDFRRYTKLGRLIYKDGHKKNF